MDKSETVLRLVFILVTGLVMGLFGLYQLVINGDENSSLILPFLFLIGGAGMVFTSVWKIYSV